MNRILSLTLLAGGMVLIVTGGNAMTSFNSDPSRILVGSPTDKAVWMLVGGIIASIAGLIGAWRNPRKI